MLVSNLTFTNSGCCRASTGPETSKESSEAPGTETKPGQKVCSTLFMSTRTFNTTFHVSSVCLSVLVSSPPVSSSPIVFFSQDIIPSHPTYHVNSLGKLLFLPFSLFSFRSPRVLYDLFLLFFHILFAFTQYFQEESLRN